MSGISSTNRLGQTLELTGLEKRYDDVLALGDCTFGAQPARMLGFPRPQRLWQDDGDAERVRAGASRCRRGALAVRANPARGEFEADWNQLNLVRTLAVIASFASLAVATTTPSTARWV